MPAGGLREGDFEQVAGNDPLANVLFAAPQRVRNSPYCCQSDGPNVGARLNVDVGPTDTRVLPARSS
jgi:hypothetical protein